MYPRNSSSPPGLFVLLVEADTGDPIEDSVSVEVVQSGGDPASGGGTLSHEGDGLWQYIPTQAETDAPSFCVFFKHADAWAGGKQVTVVTSTVSDVIEQIRSVLLDDAAVTTNGTDTIITLDSGIEVTIDIGGNRTVSLGED